MSADDSSPQDTLYHEELADLLGRVAESDSEAFGQLYDRASGALLALALTILGEKAEAEDVLQEVFLRVWKSAKRYDRKLGKAITWLMTVTRNRCYDRIRSTKRRQAAVDRAENEAQALADPPAASATDETNFDDSQRIEAALTELPKAQREAIELAFLHGYTQTEVAERLSQPLGTVKARIRRGMLRMKQILSPPNPDDDTR